MGHRAKRGVFPPGLRTAHLCEERSSMTLVEHVHREIAILVDSVAAQTARAAEDQSEEAIHDLRVAIRRLTENLRVFEDVFPRSAASMTRRDLRPVMKLAGAVRNHDIAKQLAGKAE